MKSSFKSILSIVLFIGAGLHFITHPGICPTDVVIGCLGAVSWLSYSETAPILEGELG